MKKREMRKRIPYGIYCCEGYDREGNHAACPWFRWDEQAQACRCTYLRMTSDRANDLLWDGCKECNVHYDDDERIVRQIERKQKKGYNGSNTKYD